MNVLHVVPSIETSFGGPAVVMPELTAAVAAFGVRNRVASTTNRSWAPIHWNAQGASGIEFPRIGPSGWSFSPALLRWIRKAAAEADVVHVHGAFSFPALVSAAAARAARKPYVLRPFGTLDPWSLRRRRWKKQPYYQLIEKRNLTHAAAIHVTSESEWLGIAHLGFGAKARIIPLPVKVTSSGDTRRREPGEPLRMLFLGRVHEKKGLPPLLEALRELRMAGEAIVLVVAGAGDTAYEAQIRDAVSRLELDNAVAFVGLVAGAEKEKQLRRADIFVLPSQQENFGMAVAEAMSWSVPVIISKEVGISDWVARAGCGIVLEERTPTAIAAAVFRLKDDQLRQQMGTRGRQLVETKLSPEEIGLQLERLYREVGEGR